MKSDLKRGIKAGDRLYVFDQYAMGADFTIADLYTYYCFGLAGMLASNRVGVELMPRLAERPSIARVTA